MQPTNTEPLLSGLVWHVDQGVTRVGIRLGGHFSAGSTICLRIRYQDRPFSHWNVPVVGRRGVRTNAVTGEHSGPGVMEAEILTPTWITTALPHDDATIEITCTRLAPGDHVEVRLYERGMNGDAVGGARLEAVDPTLRGILDILPTFVIQEEADFPWED